MNKNKLNTTNSIINICRNRYFITYILFKTFISQTLTCLQREHYFTRKLIVYKNAVTKSNEQAKHNNIIKLKAGKVKSSGQLVCATDRQHGWDDRDHSIAMDIQNQNIDFDHYYCNYFVRTQPYLTSIVLELLL